MGQGRVDPDLQHFTGGGYEIVGADLNIRREVEICSVDALAPRLGDLFTVESRGVVHEVAVVELATFKGGWSAICRVSDVF